VYSHGTNIHGREVTAEKRTERSLGSRVVTFLGGTGVRYIRPVPTPHLEVSISFPQQLAKKSVGKSGYYAQGVYLSHTEHIRVDFGSKKFRYSEVNNL